MTPHMLQFELSIETRRALSAALDALDEQVHRACGLLRNATDSFRDGSEGRAVVKWVAAMEKLIQAIDSLPDDAEGVLLPGDPPTVEFEVVPGLSSYQSWTPQ